jgi:hypothetical protein
LGLLILLGRKIKVIVGNVRLKPVADSVVTQTREFFSSKAPGRFTGESENFTQQKSAHISILRAGKPGPEPAGRPGQRSAVYFVTIFVLHRLAKSPDLPESKGNGPDKKHLHGNTPHLHQIQIRGLPEGQSGPVKRPDCCLGSSLPHRVQL